MFASWINYCLLDNDAVIFDTKNNRYTAVTAALALNLAGGRLSAVSQSTLCRARTLGWIADGRATAAPENHVVPFARELPPYPPSSVGPKALLSAAAALQLARCRLRLSSLDSILGRVSRENCRANNRAAGALSINDLVGAFGLARRFLAGTRSCLPSSLGLHALLASNGYRSQLVFGVKLRPFGAHCWLQADGMILGDTIEQAAPYTVIKVVG